MSAEIIQLFKTETKYKCSFCQNEVKKAIKGQNGKHICFACVALAAKRIEETE